MSEGRGGVRIVLNAAALERLIGDDENLRLVLTHQALKKFTDESLVQVIEAKLTAAVDRYMQRLEQGNLGFSEKKNLFSVLEDKVKEEIRFSANTWMGTLGSVIHSTVETEIAKQLPKTIEMLVRTRIEQAVKKALTSIQQEAITPAGPGKASK